MATNWSERSHEHALEKEFLTGLKQDLWDDIAENTKTLHLTTQNIIAIRYFNPLLWRAIKL